MNEMCARYTVDIGELGVLIKTGKDGDTLLDIHEDSVGFAAMEEIAITWLKRALRDHARGDI